MEAELCSLASHCLHLLPPPLAVAGSSVIQDEGSPGWEGGGLVEAPALSQATMWPQESPFAFLGLIYSCAMGFD